MAQTPDPAEMRSFWDRAAEDNPLWYVASELEYSSPDEDAFWRSGEADVTDVLAWAGAERGSLAVDIGCGVGRLVRPLGARFDRAIGFDVSPRMVEHATGALAATPNTEARVARGDGSLELPDGCADLVLSLQVFQHVPLRAATLRYISEAGRVLAPGGRFVFQLRTLRMLDPTLGTLERAARWVLDRVRRLRNPGPEALRAAAWRGSRVGWWEIRRAARAGGMRIVKGRWLSKRGASILVLCEKPAP